MRFAGQRFRAQSGANPSNKRTDGSVGDFRYRYNSGTQSRASMPEVNASSFTKTQQPNFNIGDFSEPEFRA